MKTILAFVIGFFFLPSGANAQCRAGRERSDLIGQVKSVDTYFIRFTMKDGKTAEAGRQPWYSDTYNIEGNNTEHVFYRHYGFDKYLYTYDANGRCTGYGGYTVTPDNTHTIHQKRLYALNDNGNIVEDKIFEARFHEDIDNRDSKLIGALTGNTIVEFEYDSRGNWTRKTDLIQSERGDKPQRYHAVERVITYH